MSAPYEIVAVPTGEFTFPQGERFAGQTGVAVAYAIRVPDAVFLFDTGFAPPSAELGDFYRAWRVRSRHLPDALGTAGVDIRSVKAVANCHLHVDHAGQNALFPGIPIYVQRAEMAAAREADYTVSTVFDFPRARIELISGEHQVAPGLRLLPTPGHSPGHQSLLVERPGGTVLLAGQAVYTRGEWLGLSDAMEGESSAPDVRAYRMSVARLRQVGASRVLFGHDRRGWPD